MSLRARGNVAPSKLVYLPTESADRAADSHETINEVLSRKLLGVRWLALQRSAQANTMLWYGTALVLILAAILRFIHLGRPDKLIFDETYYVKDAWTLWNLGYEARWPDDPNPAFEAGDVFSFTTEPSFIAHPAVGKWMIALGMQLGGGATNPAAWRLGNALAGMIAVFLMIRIARRIFASDWIGLLAGLLMAIDGSAIVHSRVALLDQWVMFFALIAFWLLLLDRDQARRRLAAGFTRLGPRPFRWLAGIALGLCCGVKWSGIYFLAAFGLLTVLWDWSARRTVARTLAEVPANAAWLPVPANETLQSTAPNFTSLGAPDADLTATNLSAPPRYFADAQNWLRRGLLHDALPAFVALVPVAIGTYIASWFSWFATPGAFWRNWAAENPDEGVQWLPEALRSLLYYHSRQWSFHVNLDSPHPYQAGPFGWIVQWRPTSMFWDRGPDEVAGGCGWMSDCVAAINSIGNPLIWLLAALSIVLVIVLGLMHRDWRALAVLSGLVSGWLPWFLYLNRTIFTFYSIAFLPWVILTLCYPVALAFERTERNPYQRAWIKRVGLVLLCLAGLITLAFYPIQVAMPVPFSWWQAMMWIRSWV